MSWIRRILVPVDASAYSEAALPLALAFADKTGAEIRLAMVNEPADLSPGFWAEAFLANHAAYLESVENAVRQRLAVDRGVSSALLEGSVASSILGEAEAADADLIVMGTHGRGGVARMWLGSIADAVVRQSHVPVALVRAEEGEDGKAEASIDAPVDIDHILVPLDGSPFGEAAIEPGLELASAFSARLTFLCTIAAPVIGSSYLPDAAELNRSYVERAEEDARVYLSGLREQHSASGVPVEAEVVTGVRPAPGILGYVAGKGVDLVVMASHARHGLPRMVMGSVADKVIRGSGTPVLVIRAEERGAASDAAEEVA
jgi:nucleotide-binding universal stress UspA family protein